MRIRQFLNFDCHCEEEKCPTWSPPSRCLTPCNHQKAFQDFSPGNWEFLSCSLFLRKSSMWLLYYWMCSSIGIIGCGWSSVWTTKIFPHQPTVGPNCANLKGLNDNNDTIIQLHTNITLRQHWLLQQTINFCSFYQTCHPSIPRRKRKKSPLNTFCQFPCKELSPPTADWLGALCPHFATRRSRRDRTWVDKAPCLSISIVIWILSSDTVCQLNQFNTNSEAAMLSMKYLRLSYFSVVMCKIWRTLFIRILHFQNPWRMGPSGLDPEGQAFVEVSSWIDMLIYSDTAMISGRRHLKTWKTLKEKALQLTQTSSSVWEWPSEDKRAWEKG